jgi:F-type H+-transporting ATPase subunit alpha
LKQSQYQPVPAAEQIAVFYAVTNGFFDALPIGKIREGERVVRKAMLERLPDMRLRIEEGKKINPDDWSALQSVLTDVMSELIGEE